METSLNLNLNPGLEMVNCYNKYFECKETKLNGLIDTLATSNLEIKIIQDVMNKLAHAKQKNQQADFTKDETMRRYITHIHKNHPTIFENCIEGFPEHLNANEPTPLAGSQITLENHVNQSLRDIAMSHIQIPVLNEGQIDVIIQGLDAQLKSHSADLNEHLMTINKTYDDRSQMTEHARQVLKESEDLIASIVHKTGR